MRKTRASLAFEMCCCFMTTSRYRSKEFFAMQRPGLDKCCSSPARATSVTFCCIRRLRLGRFRGRTIAGSAGIRFNPFRDGGNRKMSAESFSSVNNIVINSTERPATVKDCPFENVSKSENQSKLQNTPSDTYKYFGQATFSSSALW